MAREKKEIKEFVEEEVTEESSAVSDKAEILDVNTKEDMVSARVKGTWVMFWSKSSFSFKDGERYSIPRDLYNYLRNAGNIYDTL